MQWYRKCITLKCNLKKLTFFSFLCGIVLLAWRFYIGKYLLDAIRNTNHGDLVQISAKPTQQIKLRLSIYGKKPKLIYLYSSWFGRRPWPMVPQNFEFRSYTRLSDTRIIDDSGPCPVNHCRLSYNKSDLHVSDAVVIHGRDLRRNETATIMAEQAAARVENQVWIWMNQEPPVKVDVIAPRGLFHWTASYRLDADIHIPYRAFHRRKVIDRVVPKLNFAFDRHKQAMAAISNCFPLRVEIIQQLIAHGIQVDVFGRCSHLFNQTNNQCRKTPNSYLDCPEHTKHYRFFLAFENSYCHDYVTEKYYFNGLMHGMIPVVAGGANYTDLRIGIPGSYINVRDFKNIQHLAEHLKLLTESDFEYNKYFQWRMYYTIRWEHFMCRFCEALWKYDGNVQKLTKRVNFEQLWDRDKVCLKKSINDIFLGSELP